jgi:hypothetical protein
MFPVTALVLLSLAFTVGGVAIQGRADSENKGPNATDTTSPLFQGKTVEQGCMEPQRHDVRIPANRFNVASDSIQLNTRGYNYPNPGDIVMDPVRGTPADLPPGLKTAAPKAPATPPPPASPAR